MPGDRGRYGTTEERLVALETVQDRLVDIAESTQARLDGIEKAIWRSVGALSILVFLITVLAPFLWDRLGVPT